MTDTPTPLVTVRGEAQREVAPDLASFSFSANSVGDSADRVRAELAAASSQISGLLSQHAAAIERSGTSGVNVSPVYSRRGGGTRITGYSGSFTTTVVIKDFDALSTVVLALGALPNGSLNGPWWALRPDNAAYREVRLDAIADARRRADDYAAAVGGIVRSLVEISDLEQGFASADMPRRYAMSKGAPEDASFEFEPVSQTVSGQVTVRYTLSL